MNAILQYTFFNRAPKINAVQTGQSPDGVITGSLNATGPAGAVLTYSVTPDPLGERAAVVNPDGSYTFTDSLFTQPGLKHAGGPDSFTVTVDDGSAYRLTGAAGALQQVLHSLAQAIGLSGPDTARVDVGVTFAPINHPPVAVADAFSTNENTAATGNVLANDTDADGDTLTAALSGAPAHGNVTLNSDGSFSYSPASDYSGGDAFSYTVSDGWGGSAVGNATITVNYVAPPTQPSGPTLSQKVATFVGNTRGKTIANPDGSYAGECVSLVRQYLQQALGISSGAWGNAIDYRSGGSGGNQLAARGFTWHTDRNFQDGDILVFGQNSTAQTSSLGHIGIWYGGQLYDQNDGWRANARTANYSPFSDVSPAFLGYWRPSGGSTTQYPTATVMATTQRMSAATLNSQQLGTYGVGTTLSLVCYARGQSVKGYYSYAISGGYDNLWYQTTDGGYAADVDINTGTDNPVTGGC